VWGSDTGKGSEMKLREAAEMALQYFEDAHGLEDTEVAIKEALREALAQPPQKEWVRLNDDEIKEIIGPWGDTPIRGYTRKLFDQIEDKLKEKNGG